MNKYEQFLEERLFRDDWLLGQDLNLELQRRFSDVTPAYGRKIIERAVTSRIIVPSPISFGKNQFAYAHRKKTFTKEAFLRIAEVKRPALFRLIVMLDVYHGVLSHYDAMKIAASPLEDGRSKNDSIDKLFKEIALMGLGVQVANRDGVRFLVYPSLSKNPERVMANALKQMTIDATFIPDILRALQRMNIISNDRVLYRKKSEPYHGVNHNNYKWDAIAYTRTTGINEGRASEADSIEKQTLVILDVVITRKYTDHDLQGFLSRIQGTTSSVKSGRRKVLPIVIYSGVESKVLFNRIRKLGFVSLDVGTIYGSNIYRIIECVQSVKKINDFSGGSVDDLVEEALQLIGNAGQEDNLSNIKGDLFETLMFPVLQAMLPGADMDPGRELKNVINEKVVKYEYDYIIRSSRLKEIVVVELKGFANSRYIGLGDNETKNTLNWFFGRTFPFARSILTANEPGNKVTACYITTADFNPDGIEFVESLQKGKLKPSTMDLWYNGEKLIQLLEQNGFAKVLTLIRKYFIRQDYSKVNVPFAPSDDAEEILPANITSYVLSSQQRPEDNFPDLF